MNRRKFLTSCAGSAAAALLPRRLWGADHSRDLKITRIVGFDLPLKRAKYVGKNSQVRYDLGDHSRDRMVRLYTNAGIEGLGNCSASESELASLLGANPFDFFQVSAGPQFESPVQSETMPLWDLVGKALNQPVYELIFARGPARVPAYDGSIYFSDLMPEYAGKWEDRFREEVDWGFKRGYRGFKIKIGRGLRLMPAEEGFARDKAVVKIIRQHAGPDAMIAVDMNNGYDLERTKRFVADLADVKLAFVEQPFQKDVGQYLELKAFMRAHKMETMIADGESDFTMEPYKPFIAAKAFDIYEGDINRFGLEGILAEAGATGLQGLTVSPHGWGSLAGFYLALQVGRGISNFYAAENDPLESDILIADGYAMKDGTCSVPSAPGFGLKLDEAKFAARIKPRFDLKA